MQMRTALSVNTVPLHIRSKYKYYNPSPCRYTLPRRLGETLCLMCLQVPKMKLSHFCSQVCIDKAEKMGPMVLEVPTGHDTFRSGK